MEKRGVSLVVASVLLTLLAIVLAGVIYNNMRYEVIRFSPEPELDCFGIDFVVDIIREPGVDYFEVVNLGNLPIEGFYIKRFGEGELYMYEEIVRSVPPGLSDRWVLEHDFSPGRYLIVPRVEGEDLEGGVYLRPCKDIYALEIVLE